MPPQTMPSSQDSHLVTASDPPAGSISPASPRPDSTHRVVDIDLSKVRDSKGRLIPGLRYRMRHRTQFTGTRISWIFDHGADCESNGGVRWFVCRQCQLDRRHGDGVYKLTGIHAVEAHLEQAHKISSPRKPKKPELPPIQDFSNVDPRHHRPRPPTRSLPRFTISDLSKHLPTRSLSSISHFGKLRPRNYATSYLWVALPPSEQYRRAQWV